MNLKAVLDKASSLYGEKLREFNEIKGKYENKTDQELIRIAKSDGFFGKSPIERMAALSILQERGYSASDIN